MKKSPTLTAGKEEPQMKAAAKVAATAVALSNGSRAPSSLSTYEKYRRL